MRGISTCLDPLKYWGLPKMDPYEAPNAETWKLYNKTGLTLCDAVVFGNGYADDTHDLDIEGGSRLFKRGDGYWYTGEGREHAGAQTWTSPGNMGLKNSHLLGLPARMLVKKFNNPTRKTDGDHYVYNGLYYITKCELGTSESTNQSVARYRFGRPYDFKNKKLERKHFEILVYHAKRLKKWVGMIQTTEDLQRVSTAFVEYLQGQLYRRYGNHLDDAVLDIFGELQIASQRIALLERDKPDDWSEQEEERLMDIEKRETAKRIKLIREDAQRKERAKLAAAKKKEAILYKKILLEEGKSVPEEVEEAAALVLPKEKPQKAVTKKGPKKKSKKKSKKKKSKAKRMRKKNKPRGKKSPKKRKSKRKRGRGRPPKETAKDSSGDEEMKPTKKKARNSKKGKGNDDDLGSASVSESVSSGNEKASSDGLDVDDGPAYVSEEDSD